MLDRSPSCRALAGIVVLSAVVVPSTAFALDPFTDGSAGLNNPDVSSGAPIAIADMNSDGLDDIVRLDEGYSLEIEYQQEDGSFTHLAWGEFPGGEERREPISSRLDDVWDSWATLLFVLAVLSAEWILRKRLELV